jgi:hypothetical protein
MTYDPSPLPIKPLEAKVLAMGKYRLARSVAALAEILVNEWPDDHKGAKWRHAMVVCLESLASQTNSEAARDAFVDAAMEAGISVVPDVWGHEPPARTTPKRKRH